MGNSVYRQGARARALHEGGLLPASAVLLLLLLQRKFRKRNREVGDARVGWEDGWMERERTWRYGAEARFENGNFEFEENGTGISEGEWPRVYQVELII